MTGEFLDVAAREIAAALPAYEIGGELGRGACGIVVGGRHRRLGREVAVKQLSSRFDPGSDVAARFLAEARVLASLDHPHVVPIYDFVEADGMCLLIMERLTGGTLGDRMSAGGVSPQTACAAMLATCSALEYAHSKGVLHRDIKPHNLLFSGEGAIKVADFGIAKVVAALGSVETRTGMLLGTPAYIAPEQIRGDSLSPAVDVYATGIVLYELLCGELPFPVTGDLMADLYRRANEEPVPLLDQAPALPRTLGEVTARALARDPGHRYTTAAELADAISAAAATEWGPDWMHQAGAGSPVRAGAAGPPVVSGPTLVEPEPGEHASTATGGVLERDHERRELRAIVDAARSGAGAVALIDGPAGIGKTTLLRDLAALASEAGVTVLRARGGEMERDIAYGGVRQLLEREVSALAQDEIALRGAARLALPVLGLSEVDDAAPAEGDREFALNHGLYWLVTDLAERRPLLLLVDDLHELDAPSLRFLLYLVRRVEGLPIGIVAAARAGATPSDGDAFAQLAAETAVRRLRPRGLSLDAIAEIVRRRMYSEPSTAFVKACAEVTAGNPFLVEQLLGAATYEGLSPDDAAVARVRELVPDELTRTVLGRLEREPDEVVALAQAVAVLGDGAEVRVAAQVAELSPFAASDCAHRLADLELLRSGEPLRFLHPLLRATVLAGMAPDVRAHAHAQAAKVLEDNDADASAVAAHLFDLEPAGDPHVVAVLRAAAEDALQSGAADIAVRQLRRALREPPGAAERGAVLADLGYASFLAGDGAAAAQALDESVALAADPGERLVRELRAFRAHFQAEGRLDPDNIMGIVDQMDAIGEAPEACHLLFGDVVGAGTNLPTLLPALDRRLAHYASARGETAIERAILGTLARVACHRGDTAAQAASFAERSLAGGIAEESTEAVAMFLSLFTLIEADRLDVADGQIAAAMVQARSRGSVVAYASLSGFNALVAYQRGDVVRAEAEAVTAVDTGSLHAALIPIVNGCLVRARLAAGDLDGAAAVVAPLGDMEIPDLTAFNHLLVARAQVRFAVGRLDEAVDEMRLALLRVPRVVRYSRVLPWRQFAVPVLLAAGQRDEAAEVAADDVSAARSWGTPGAMGAALATQALCMEPDDRIEILERAIASLEDGPSRLDLATAWLALGDTLREQGFDQEARDPLRIGLELAHECGARALVERAQTTLLATGARPERLHPHRHVALSPGELRVAELAADGMSNRTIAEALFLTAKEVETDLGRVYSKLGISGRGELAGALGT